jgi:hypothetical protein
VKYWFAGLRLIFAVVGLVAIVATFFDTASRVTINPFNFFGFFTTQSNMIMIVVMIIAAVATFSGRPQTEPLVLARACATTYVVIVGIVYNTLLTGLEGGISLGCANFVLHVALPIYGALDWILLSDRAALPWKKLWAALIFPIVWLVVILVRGATDGWVPYPFLSPKLGYATVAGYCVAIAVATIVVATAVWALGRLRFLAPSGRASMVEAEARDQLEPSLFTFPQWTARLRSRTHRAGATVENHPGAGQPDTLVARGIGQRMAQSADRVGVHRF